MEITSLGPKQLEEYLKLGRKQERVKEKEKAGGGDEVVFSESARDAQRIKASVESLPDVRSEKIEKLRMAIASGEYNVDGRAVADKMLRESILDLLL